MSLLPRENNDFSLSVKGEFGARWAYGGFALVPTAAWHPELAYLHGKGEGCKAERTQPRTACSTAVADLSARREAFAGSDSNCTTWANNPKPSPTPSIRTQRPQLLAPCSCCPGSEEQHKAQICPWRAPSTGCRGVGAGAIEVPCSVTQGSANSLQLYKPRLLSCRADMMVFRHHALSSSHSAMSSLRN